MSEAIYTVTSGAIVQEMRLGMISNNLSNIGTAGYKEDHAIFKALLAGADKNSKDEKNNGQKNVYLNNSCFPSNYHVRLVGSRTNFSQGQIRQTGNTFDFAIDGDGFFEINTPDGVRYTRNGNFCLNKNGNLITQEGYNVMGKNGEISIEGREVTVDNEGNISVEGKEIGSLKIVDFEKPYYLKKIGDNLFSISENDNVGKPAKEVRVNQGYIELSNVDAIKSMTEMIEVLRAYESYQKAIQSMDEMTSKAINEIGKLV